MSRSAIKEMALLSELEKFEQEIKELGSEIAPLTAGISTSAPQSSRPAVPSVISAPPVASSSAQPNPPSSPLLVPQVAVRPPPPRPPVVTPVPAPPVSNATPWLLNPGGVTAPVGNASTSSQFTYATSGLPFPPAQSSTSSLTSNSPASYFPVPIHLQQQSSQFQQPYVQFQPQVPPIVKPPQYTYQSVYQAPIATTDIFSLPQQQQAQQLFQRDAQTITPEALESVKAALASGDNEHKAEAKKKAIPRKAAGQAWEDPTLSDWPENDFRLFCGDLGNEVNDEVLTKAFSRYTAFNMARVVRDKRTGKTKGYGFVSFSSPADLALALKEMNGKYVGNRPIKLRKSTWKERTDIEALSKQKNNKRLKTSKKNILHKVDSGPSVFDCKGAR
ncbi:hypothetical protein GOP47_0012389 [Adiantum capillus-veneris]|uniref:RRM domain-containing protein n=1 Tax=Adiantum capillus-veneris TaxID=13818 RepID=A0A9D4UQK5_ADICA|nr:hypothetical protein GOP47_0012389 [Adiantum capillus-veneris]